MALHSPTEDWTMLNLSFTDKFKKIHRFSINFLGVYTFNGGRISDNLQIDNRQIDNLQIDNLQIDNLQIDNRQIDNLTNFRQIDNLQIDN